MDLELCNMSHIFAKSNSSMDRQYSAFAFVLPNIHVVLNESRCNSWI